ncbi:MAG: ATP synthase F0 subunit B [Acidobacteriota bacterium]
MKRILFRMKRPLATLLFAGALLATPVLAQEAEHKGSEAAEQPSMELWKWANFAILAGILGYLISKNLGPVLVARSREIHEGLAAGERAKADADARSAAVMAKLSGLDQAIAQMQASAKEDQNREAARIQRETAAELARIRQHALLEIESAGKLARLEVRRQAAVAAIELAERKLRSRMSPDVQAALLRNFTGEIAAVSSHES